MIKEMVACVYLLKYFNVTVDKMLASSYQGSKYLSFKGVEKIGRSRTRG